jgi:beta-glucanase (GH16 family)
MLLSVLTVLAVSGVAAVAVGSIHTGRPVSATAPHRPAPAGPSELSLRGLHVAFQDDFNGKTLNTHKWGLCWPWIAKLACTNRQEAEFYRPGNVSLSHGLLRLTARRQRVTAPGWPNRDYTSGLVTTAGHFKFRYGVVEARIKLPPGVGFWTGFWMLPSDHMGPPEIDVMEHLGLQPTTAIMAYHRWNTKGREVANNTAFISPHSLEQAWHTYAVDWEPGKIRWYIDGKLRNRYVGPVTTTSMSPILNLAVSSYREWGLPTKSTPFPSTLLVDWLRVWQKKAES